MKTINEAAESAAKEIGIENARRINRRDHLLTHHGMAAIIARHFSDFAALRDAAERALAWFENDRRERLALVDQLSADAESNVYVNQTKEVLTALRGLLNTQQTKET